MCWPISKRILLDSPKWGVYAGIAKDDSQYVSYRVILDSTVRDKANHVG